MLTGALLSGVQLAVSMSNTGGAWDNAKKLIGSNPNNDKDFGKGTDCYKAAVVGDTVGDPLKVSIMNMSLYISIRLFILFFDLNRIHQDLR